MSIPPSYSDRPLWIILTVDAALTPVGVFAAAWLLRINDPLQAIRTGALGTGVAVGAGVVIVGVASMIRDAIIQAKSQREAEEITQETPAAYTPPRVEGGVRRSSREWQHPTPVVVPSIPDQFVIDADDKVESAALEEEEAMVP